MKMKAIDRLMKTIQTIGGGNQITLDQLIQKSHEIGTNLKKVEVSNTLTRNKIEDKLPGVVTFIVQHRTLSIGLTRDITDADLQSFVRVLKVKPVVAKKPRKAKGEVQEQVSTVEKTLDNAQDSVEATATVAEDAFFSGAEPSTSNG